MNVAGVRPPLRRPREVLLSGVSVGLAGHLRIPAALVRLGFVVLTAAGGFGLLYYAWLWAFTPLVPAAGQDGPRDVRRGLPVAQLLLIVMAAAAVVAVAAHIGGWNGPLLPGSIESVLFGIATVAWTLVADRRDPSQSPRAGATLRTVAASVLILEGAVLLIGQSRPLMAVLAVASILAGAVILVIPRFVELWDELLGERSARAREEQRADIAAHLHDSVLQTLALIQNRAGPQSEAARLARAQERELRDWLFAGTDPFAGDLATELRTLAAALELEHASRIEVVTVGEVADVVSPAMTGAAREAMLNAARHAGGDISVYAEATPAEVEVFVRDRGSGFEPESVPAGRLGIRESIIGRLARAGGSAVLSSGPTGTEVHLRLPRTTS